jgi:hypothetical protein
MNALQMYIKRLCLNHDLVSILCDQLAVGYGWSSLLLLKLCL